MVTYMSGHKYDNSPYTELVSLDALTFSSDKAYATNAPTKTEMLRGYAMLWFLAHAAYQGTYSHKIIADEEANTMGVVLQSLKKANLDPRSLLQKTLREDNARNDTEHCSVAYREDGDTKQRLMRMIMTSDLGKSDVHFNFWEHYPATPSATAKYCEDFSPVPIYLQDVANQSMVDTYGKDYYAKRPISSYNEYVGSPPQLPHHGRQQGLAGQQLPVPVHPVVRRAVPHRHVERAHPYGLLRRRGGLWCGAQDQDREGSHADARPAGYDW